MKGLNQKQREFLVDIMGKVIVYISTVVLVGSLIYKQTIIELIWIFALNNPGINLNILIFTKRRRVLSQFEQAVLIIMGTFLFIAIGAVIYDYLGRRAEKKAKEGKV